jgi:hypothetical protein
MIIFINGRAVSLNNNKENGIQFLWGHAHPVLGSFVSTSYQSTWKIFIS